MLQHPSAPLTGYQPAEITLTEDSHAAGRKLQDVAWPQAGILCQCYAGAGSARQTRASS